MTYRHRGETEGNTDGGNQRNHGGNSIENPTECQQQQDNRQHEGQHRRQFDVTLAGRHLLVFDHRHARQSYRHSPEFR